MILDTGKIKYDVVREVRTGEVNDVVVCKNMGDRLAAYKTVWIVKNRNLAKSLIKGFSKTEESICEEYFVRKNNVCFVLDYEQERPLNRFYLGNIHDKNTSRQQIWLDIVTQCMTSKIPNGVLNLILKQGQINIAPDGSIGFGYMLDLEGYDENISEKENVTRCASLILELIYMDDTKVKDATVLLLEKKLKRSKYDEFIQLFKDIKIIMQDDSDTSKIQKFKRFVTSRQDKIYKVLSALCVVLIVVVAVNLLGRIFLPDFSFWKLFTNSFKQIGTQSLLN